MKPDRPQVSWNLNLSINGVVCAQRPWIPPVPGQQATPQTPRKIQGDKRSLETRDPPGATRVLREPQPYLGNKPPESCKTLHGCPRENVCGGPNSSPGGQFPSKRLPGPYEDTAGFPRIEAKKQKERKRKRKQICVVSLTPAPSAGYETP